MKKRNNIYTILVEGVLIVVIAFLLNALILNNFDFQYKFEISLTEIIGLLLTIILALYLAHVVEAGREQKKAIDVFFANTGLVFQIVDDILDVEGSEEELGKPIGSDSENGKSTFITLYGLDESKKKVEELTKEANDLLYKQFGEKAEVLINYTKMLSQRKK
mgnify:CR=1 FL=1